MRRWKPVQHCTRPAVVEVAAERVASSIDVVWAQPRTLAVGDSPKFLEAANETYATGAIRSRLPQRGEPFHATIRRCQTPPGAALGNSDDMAYRFVRSMRSGDWYARTTC